MIRNHDPEVLMAEDLIRGNKTGYVVKETLELATALIEMDEDMKYMQHEYSRMLPVVAAFRFWRHGDMTTEQFLEYLRNGESANKALGLNDWAWKRENDEENYAKWQALRDGRRPKRGQ